MAMYLRPRHRRPLSRERAFQLAIAVSVVALACINLVAFQHASDLDVYRLGGRAVIDGRSLYEVRIGYLGFTYPPVAGLAFSFLAAVPGVAAVIMLTALSLFALWVILRLVIPNLSLKRPFTYGGPAAIGVVCLCVSEPVRATLGFGQVNLVLAAIVLADLLLPSHGRYRGIGVGVAAAFKLTPAIFILYLLVRRQYRAAATATGVFFSVAALTAVLLPTDSKRFWMHEMLSGTGIGHLDGENNNSLYGMLLRSLPGDIATMIWLPLAIAATVIGLSCAVRLDKSGRNIAAIGAVGVTACVVSPVAWDHHWIWCIPWLIGLSLPTARNHNRINNMSPQVSAAIIAALVVFTIRDVIRACTGTAWPPVHFLAVNAFLIVAAIGAARCLKPARRKRLRDHHDTVAMQTCT